MVLAFVFLWVALMGVFTGDMFVALIAASLSAAWFAVYFVPMPCNCVKPCSKGRCERE